MVPRQLATLFETALFVFFSLVRGEPCHMQLQQGQVPSATLDEKATALGGEAA